MFQTWAGFYGELDRILTIDLIAIIEVNHKIILKTYFESNFDAV